MQSRFLWFVLLALLACAADVDTAPAKTITVSVGPTTQRFKFVPATLTQVTLNSTLKFIAGTTGHNVLFTKVPLGLDATKLSRPALLAIGVPFTVKLTKKGNYAYICGPHARFGMTGSVAVV